MMRYITNNDVVSTSSLYLSHGLTWGKHRYIRREGSPGSYRYVYPEDVQKQGFISRVKSALKNYESRVNEAQKRLSSVKMAYDRTRKIDDIAPSVISEFKKLFRPDASVELSKNEVMSRGIGGHSAANKTTVFWQPDGTFKRVRGKKVG